MSGTPNKKAEEARALYDQGMKLVDIAAKLGVPDGTVRRWKSTQNWDKKQSERSVKSERSECKANVRNDGQNEKKKRGPEPEVKKLLMNEQLTDKQKMFCIYYVKYFNATKAVLASGYDTTTNANRMGYNLLCNPAIREEIERLKQGKLNRALLSADDLFQKMIDIACADINDYVDFGREVVPVMGPFGPIVTKDGPLLKPINSIHFKNSNEVDGTLISEVKVGKDGASIKLQDKMRAIQWLSDRVDLLPVEMQQKIQLEKEKMERKDTNDKARLALDLKKVDGGNEDALAKLDDILSGINEGMKHD